ncbi:hypothetical protein [Pseudidiomarina halophila]|uniref:hypothetical protein n=1 Tax=Pseudidiomarina halophila TaxID=1449799 RepID=UPI003612ABDA
MSEENSEDNLDDLAEGLEQKKFSGKKLVLFVILPLLLLLIGGGVAFMFLGGDDHQVAEGEHGAEQAELHDENLMSPRNCCSSTSSRCWLI